MRSHLQNSNNNVDFNRIRQEGQYRLNSNTRLGGENIRNGNDHGVLLPLKLKHRLRQFPNRQSGHRARQYFLNQKKKIIDAIIDASIDDHCKVTASDLDPWVHN